MAGVDLHQAIDSIAPRMDQLLQKALAGNGAEVAIMDSILTLLQGAGLLYVQHAHSDQVGVHPDNRYSLDLDFLYSHCNVVHCLVYHA